jgi:hypothetical protein
MSEESLTVRAPSRAYPVGWQMVPTKHEGRAGLTHEMCSAFWAAFHDAEETRGHFESTNAGYNAMLAAAPDRGAHPLYDALNDLRQFLQIRYSLSPEHIKDGEKYQCVDLNALWKVILAADVEYGTRWGISLYDKLGME